MSNKISAEKKSVKLTNKQKFKNIPKDKQEIILPPSTRKRNAGNKSIVKPSNIDPEIVKRHSLRSRLIAQALDGIKLLQWGISGAEDEAKHEDECNDGFCLRGPLDERGAFFIGDWFAVGAVDHVCGDEGADEDEDEDDGARGDEELWSAAPFVGVDGAKDGAGEGHDVLEAVEEETGVVVGYTGTLKHSGVVVLRVISIEDV